MSGDFAAFSMIIAVPVYTIAMFSIALYRFIKILRLKKAEPERVTAAQVRGRLAFLLIASVMLIMLLAFVGFVIWLASSPVPFM